MSNEDNLYGLPDDVFDRIEKELAHAEIDAETGEQFLDSVFPGVPAETKAKIALFAEKYAEMFLEENEDEIED